MKMKLDWTSSILLCLLYIAGGTSLNTMDRKLTEMLLKGYEKTTRPVDHYKDSVNVTMDIGLRELSSLDERDQVLKIKAWIRLYWYDAFLKWNASQYGGIDRTEILSSSIWLPDLVLINSATNENLSHSDLLVVVTSNGDVSWKFPVIIASQCDLDVKYFPFDRQVCPLEFASWVYPQSRMDLYAKGSRGDTSVFQESKSWIMDSFIAQRRVKTFKTDEKYPDVTYSLRLTRRPLYVLFNLVLPVVMIIILGMLAFWLPPDDGEKIGLCVTLLVALSFIMLLLGDKMPPTAISVPLLGQFYAAVVIMLTATTVLSTIVIHTHFRGKRGKRVPNWIRIVVLKGLARFLCFDLTCKSDLYRDREGNLNTTTMKSFSNYGMTNEDETSEKENNNTQIIDSPVLYEIKEKLQLIESTITSRQKAEEEQEELNTDWRNVAMVMDRLFMCIYALVCIFTGLGLMLRRPTDP